MWRRDGKDEWRRRYPRGEADTFRPENRSGSRAAAVDLGDLREFSGKRGSWVPPSIMLLSRKYYSEGGPWASLWGRGPRRKYMYVRG